MSILLRTAPQCEASYHAPLLTAVSLCPLSHPHQACLATLLEHVVRRLRFLSSLPSPPRSSPLSSSAYSLLSSLNEAAPTAVVLHGMQLLLANQNTGVQRRVMRLLADKARGDAEAKRREVWGRGGARRKERMKKKGEKKADGEGERKAEEEAERHRRAAFLSLLRSDAAEYAAICSQLLDIGCREGGKGGERGGEKGMEAGAALAGSGDGSLIATRQVALQVRRQARRPSRQNGREGWKGEDGVVCSQVAS